VTRLTHSENGRKILPSVPVFRYDVTGDDGASQGTDSAVSHCDGGLPDRHDMHPVDNGDDSFLNDERIAFTS
jgi:hypothetical protein